MSGVALTILCFVLFLWTPAGFAAEAATALPSLAMRGMPGLIELSAHGAVAALSAAAGWSLWTRASHGPVLARAALIASAAISVQSLYWSVLPRQTPPGSELPLAAIAVLHAALWLVFLQRSSRVRAMSA
jgi:hypothetical protein